ncbi:Ubiquitin carboxyl-terminal hydrolase isozyme L3 [Podochytrium sp. JEL0797]|nr:Ubiquitin carboxyl-terminal hydrolase isozyme L3 [Podochytrium sp. JEL0797]
MHWLPLESNPEVMNDFLAKLGLPSENNVSFSDVWGLDPDALAFLPQPIKALLLLFPCSAVDKGAPIGTVVPAASLPEHPDAPFFIKQTIGNACGTMAILHAIANNRNTLDMGSGAMHNIMTRLTPLSPAERAAALESDTDLERIHQQSSLEGQTAAPSAEDEVDLHFVAFVGINNKVYEFDGRKDGPVLHGSFEGNGFVEAAVEVVKQFMQRDPDGNNFTVVALGSSE